MHYSELNSFEWGCFRKHFSRARVCVYCSTCWFLPAARRLWHTWEVRIKDLLLWVLVGCFLPSSFISISESIIFDLQRRKLQPIATGENTNDIILALGKMIYFDLGYKTVTPQAVKLLKNTKDKEATLI